MLTFAGQLTQEGIYKHKDGWLQPIASRASSAYTATCEHNDKSALGLSLVLRFIQPHVKGDRETALTYMVMLPVLW